jgi:predicted nucleic acid-binding protein
MEFIKYSKIYIDIDKSDSIKKQAESIISTGVKTKDAYHVACAVEAGCEYFISTDDKLLKYRSKEIELMNPLDFIKRLEVEANE